MSERCAALPRQGASEGGREGGTRDESETEGRGVDGGGGVGGGGELQSAISKGGKKWSKSKATKRGGKGHDERRAAAR